MLYTVNQIWEDTLQSKCFFNPRPRQESSSKRKINQNLQVKQKTLFTHLAGHFDWTFVHYPLDAFITRGRGQRSWVGVEPLIERKDIYRGYPTMYVIRFFWVSTTSCALTLNNFIRGLLTTLQIYNVSSTTICFMLFNVIFRMF